MTSVLAGLSFDRSKPSTSFTAAGALSAIFESEEIKKGFAAAVKGRWGVELELNNVRATQQSEPKDDKGKNPQRQRKDVWARRDTSGSDSANIHWRQPPDAVARQRVRRGKTDILSERLAALLQSLTPRAQCALESGTPPAHSALSLFALKKKQQKQIRDLQG